MLTGLARATCVGMAERATAAAAHTEERGHRHSDPLPPWNQEARQDADDKADNYESNDVDNHGPSKARRLDDHHERQTAPRGGPGRVLTTPLRGRGRCPVVDEQDDYDRLLCPAWAEGLHLLGLSALRDHQGAAGQSHTPAVGSSSPAACRARTPGHSPDAGRSSPAARRASSAGRAAARRGSFRRARRPRQAQTGSSEPPSR